MAHAQVPKPAPSSKPDAQARPSGDKTAPDTPKRVHELTPADLEAFFDGIIPLQLERSDVAGASVLVMKDGQLLLEKGYGYSNFKERSPSTRPPPSSVWLPSPNSSPGLR